MQQWHVKHTAQCNISTTSFAQMLAGHSPVQLLCYGRKATSYIHSAAQTVRTVVVAHWLAQPLLLPLL
jgi:hypothetical protein